MSAFLFAVQFLTRLPVPDTGAMDDATVARHLARARRWFPLVGGLVGAVTALAVMLAGLAWPLPVAVVLALAAEALLTGVFHEDAVADFCDAMGGGRTREDKLAILRDSRIGSYGALGLGLAVALRATLMLAMPPALLTPALIAAGAAGRWTILCVMALVRPVPGRDGLAAGQPDLGWRMVMAGLLLAMPALGWAMWLSPAHTGAGLAACLAVAALHARFLRRKLGGSTGDALGFAAYAGMLVMMLALAAR